jgi:VanZ family protein
MGSMMMTDMTHNRSRDVQRGIQLFALAALTGVVVLTIVPAAERPVTGLGQNLEHFLCFAAAGAVAAYAFDTALKTMLLGSVLFALALELAQIPLPTRHARLEDFIVDALGACVGILCARLCMRLFRRA